MRQKIIIVLAGNIRQFTEYKNQYSTTVTNEQFLNTQLLYGNSIENIRRIHNPTDIVTIGTFWDLINADILLKEAKTRVPSYT